MTAPPKAVGEGVPEAPANRWVAVIESASHGNYRLVATSFVGNVPPSERPNNFEVASALVALAHELLKHPNTKLQTMAEKAQEQRRQHLLKAYPARFYVAKPAGAETQAHGFVCAVCKDLFEGTLVPVDAFQALNAQAPTGLVCEWHDDPTKAPTDFETAAQLKGDAEEASIDPPVEPVTVTKEKAPNASQEN